MTVPGEFEGGFLVQGAQAVWDGRRMVGAKRPTLSDEIIFMAVINERTFDRRRYLGHLLVFGPAVA